MSAYAKAIVSALVAVLYAGLVAYQSATGDGLQLLDLLPVLVALFGAVLTYLVPNVPQLPWAKAVGNGALTVLAAHSSRRSPAAPAASPSSPSSCPSPAPWPSNRCPTPPGATQRSADRPPRSRRA